MATVVSIRYSKCALEEALWHTEHDPSSACLLYGIADVKPPIKADHGRCSKAGVTAFVAVFYRKC